VTDDRDPRRIPFRAMIPNAITALALCMGLTGVRFAIGGEWEKALAAIIIAGILDGMDGRIARLLEPEQCLTVEETLLATIVNPTWLTGDERRRGKLLPGYLADLVVLSRDPIDCTVDELETVEVVATMVGGRWVHLRRCLTCDHVGCCDSSPARHASAHARTIGHPVVASAEPGEHWRWCYLDEVGA